MFRTHIVLNKDFIQGCKPETISSLINEGKRLVACSEFYVEVTTMAESHPPCRRRAHVVSEIGICESCARIRLARLRKLHGHSDSIDVLDPVGTLFRYEIDNQRPCTPLAERFFHGQFNPNFRFVFSEAHDRLIQGERNHLEIEWPMQYDQVILEILRACPRLTQQDLQRKEVILEVYSRLRSSRLPPAELLDEGWAIYRRVQVDLFAALDYRHSLVNGEITIQPDRKAHNQTDLIICLVGALVGAVATDEKFIMRCFKVICPEGQIVPVLAS